MPHSRYQHIIWDWNGTLLDDLDYSIAVMNHLLERRALPQLDRERYHALFNFPVRDYYGRLGFDSQHDSFENLSVEFISGYDARRLECTLHHGVKSVLAAIAAAGLSQSILSAYRQETLREIIEHFGISDCFTDIVGLDNIHAHSKVALGLTLVSRLGLPKSQILLVGDTLHDHEVARELGVDCALIAAGHHPAARLRQVSEHVFADLPSFAVANGFQSNSASGGGII